MSKPASRTAGFNPQAYVCSMPLVLVLVLLVYPCFCADAAEPQSYSRDGATGAFEGFYPRRLAGRGTAPTKQSTEADDDDGDDPSGDNEEEEEALELLRTDGLSPEARLDIERAVQFFAEALNETVRERRRRAATRTQQREARRPWRRTVSPLGPRVTPRDFYDPPLSGQTQTYIKLVVAIAFLTVLVILLQTLLQMVLRGLSYGM